MQKAVWVGTFERWYAQTSVAFQNIMPENKKSIQAFVANASLPVCNFCLGPCGACPERYSGESSACDGCEQDVHGFTECTLCPLRPSDNLNKVD